jgi:hypothetical protein
MIMMTDVAAAARVLREGHERLQRQSHPDPYIQSYMPGGSLFMRNPSIPLEALFPNGIPPEYSRFVYLLLFLQVTLIDIIV